MNLRNRENHGSSLQHMGWMAGRISPLPPVEGEAFFLTSPFIELLVCVRNRRTSSRQRDESPEPGKSRILTPTHGLDGRKNFSVASGRGRSIFLDIPFYRTRLPENWVPVPSCRAQLGVSLFPAL